MAEKIELTTLGSNEAQGCGDNCGCGSAKAAEVSPFAETSPAEVAAPPAKCICGKGEICVC